MLIGVVLELAALLYSKLDTVPSTYIPLLCPGASVKPPPGNGTSENSLFGPATVTGIPVPIAVQAPALVWLPTYVVALVVTYTLTGAGLGTAPPTDVLPNLTLNELIVFGVAELFVILK